MILLSLVPRWSFPLTYSQLCRCRNVDNNEFAKVCCRHKHRRTGKILQSDGIDSLYEDVVVNKEEISFPNAYNQIKDKNILIVGANYDSVSPINEMILPLWNLLAQHKSSSIQKFVEYPAEHGLLGRRISVIKEIAYFIENVQNKIGE